MNRIVRRARPPLTRVQEMVIAALGIAGLAGIVFVGALSAFALYR